jgi:hypothetical protein
MGYRDVAKVGLGGPVGSGKTALVQQLVPRLDDAGYDLGVIANDIMTQEDAQRLQSSFAGQIEKDLIAGVETGACPHTGIREDPSMNLDKIDEFSESHPSLRIILFLLFQWLKVTISRGNVDLESHRLIYWSSIKQTLHRTSMLVLRCFKKMQWKFAVITPQRSRIVKPGKELTI